ncbi:MAG: diaminopimelate epimerase [Ignavibacteria bacterium]
MKIKFEKYTGAGNDFIVIHNSNFIPEPELIQKICDRHFGIGADGVLIIEGSDKADFQVSYFNSDGSGDALCVNGARCAVMFAFQKKLCGQKCSFEFIKKIFHANVLDDFNVQLFIDYSPLVELNKEINFLDERLRTHFVDIGSRHLIINWSDFENIYSSLLNEKDFETFDINYFGRLLRNHQEFYPEGVNINFIRQVENNEIRIRTYERGVEFETLACGSGSIASSIIAYITLKLNPPIKVITTSQKVFEIKFKELNGVINDISITGHAQKIFEGEIEL